MTGKCGYVYATFTFVTCILLHNSNLTSLHQYINNVLNQSINQSIKTHFYSAICRERIRGAVYLVLCYYYCNQKHTNHNDNGMLCVKACNELPQQIFVSYVRGMLCIRILYSVNTKTTLVIVSITVI